MNRIDRVSAILTHLQSKRLVKAREIADRFNISLRTVYRDIKALEEAGVPVSGEAGLGYSIMEGYRLPPVMFTKEEATAFVTAGKIVDKLTDKPTRSSYETALLKIKAVLRYADKDYIESINDHIAVLHNPYLPEEQQNHLHLQTILQHIAARQVMEIGYFANHNQQYSNRVVEPIGIFFLGSYWHLIAFCRLRNDYRDFRTDRISYINATKTQFLKQHPPLQSFIDKMKHEKEMHKIVISVDKNILKYFGEQKYYNGFVSQKEVNNKIEMTFLSASLMGFSKFFMLYGEHADILEPAELKDLVKQNLVAMQKRIG